jgi:hypothetical protein
MLIDDKLFLRSAWWAKGKAEMITCKAVTLEGLVKVRNVYPGSFSARKVRLLKRV